MKDLERRIAPLFAKQAEHYGEKYFRAFDELKAGPNEGRVRTGFQPAIGLRGSIIAVILNV